MFLLGLLLLIINGIESTFSVVMFAIGISLGIVPLIADAFTSEYTYNMKLPKMDSKYIYKHTKMNMISCIFSSAICMLVLDLYSFGIYIIDFVYYMAHVGRVKFD